MKPEYVVIGGGIVGCAVAYGLLKSGHKVTVLDGGDSDHRASRGNFGLVWLSCKGFGAPHYAAWTQRSIGLWRELANELEEVSGETLDLVQKGGYDFFFSEQELQQRVEKYQQLGKELGIDYPYEIWDRAKLKQEEPQIGPDVIGAIFGPEDGHVNPLKLLKSYHKAITALGGKIISQVNVVEVEQQSDGRFTIEMQGGRTMHSDKVVLSAGLGSAELGSKLGFKAPVTPQKGQILITEKLPPMINRPSGIIRQVDEGGIQIGDSKEAAGFNSQDTISVTAAIAERAIATYPFLANVQLVRSWGALRIISPDGLPIYQKSQTHSGAYMISCHSGITLAAVHSYLMPLWLENKAEAPDLEKFDESRF
jgi:hydrogen cyanide synthase HcnC